MNEQNPQPDQAPQPPQQQEQTQRDAPPSSQDRNQDIFPNPDRYRDGAHKNLDSGDLEKGD